LRVCPVPWPILWFALAVVVGRFRHRLDRTGVLALRRLRLFRFCVLGICLWRLLALCLRRHLLWHLRSPRLWWPRRRRCGRAPAEGPRRGAAPAAATAAT